MVGCFIILLLLFGCWSCSVLLMFSCCRVVGLVLLWIILVMLLCVSLVGWFLLVVSVVLNCVWLWLVVLRVFFS